MPSGHRPGRDRGTSCRRRPPSRCRPRSVRLRRARAGRSGRSATARRSSCRSTTAFDAAGWASPRAAFVSCEMTEETAEEIGSRSSGRPPRVMLWSTGPVGGEEGLSELGDLVPLLRVGHLDEIQRRRAREARRCPSGEARRSSRAPRWRLGVFACAWYAVARSRNACASFGFSSTRFCASEIDGIPEPPPLPRRMSPKPTPPAPTPKPTKPSPKASARKRNTHFACLRRRGKNMVSSTTTSARRVTAAGRVRCVRRRSARAMSPLLSHSESRRTRE